MAEIHHHPDGDVYVRTDAGEYADTYANFVNSDFGQALPDLPAGAAERRYVQGVKHTLQGPGFLDGGPMPWPLGDQIIAGIAGLLAAQDARRNPPPTLEQAIAAKDAAIEAEFARRHTAPILYTVGGVEHEWHADGEAVTNIMGVVVLINSGAPVPDPRTWTPVGSLTAVSITHAELIGLGAAIAARKDALFAIKKTKQAEVAALSDVDVIAAYDATVGWNP